MEEGEDSPECLISLEFVVAEVNVDPRLVPTARPPCRPFRLVVAVRLLDFPTLLVRAPQCRPGPVVPFGRGKCCIFKLRPEALKGLLRRSPLCTQLLALPPTRGAARLLGSSNIFLDSVAEELFLGTGPGGRRGHFALRDLMGEVIGELSLSYRLSNLGIAHSEQRLSPGEPLFERPSPPLTPPLLVRKPKQHVYRSTPPPPASLCSVSSNRAVQDETELDLEIIHEGGEDQELDVDSSSVKSNQSSSGSSSSNTSTSSSSTESGDSESDDQTRLRLRLRPNQIKIETKGNIFCPPPLYYSHTPRPPAHKPRSPRHETLTPSRMSLSPSPTPKPPKPVVAAAPQKSSKKKEVMFPPMAPVQKVQQKERPSDTQEAGLLNPMPGNLKLLKKTLDQLPLLNALLMELSLLNDQTVEPDSQSSRLSERAEDNAKPPSPSVKSLCSNWEEKKISQHCKERETSPSPRFIKNNPDHFGCFSPTLNQNHAGKGYIKSVVHEKPGSSEKCNPKENALSRRKLTFGLTNTLRLRLQRANLSMFMTPEKQFNHRKKYTEGAKKGKVSLSRVKFCSTPDPRLKSATQSNENVNLDENSHEFIDKIESLMQNSVDQDCYTAVKEVQDCHTAVREATSDLQSNVVTGMKDIENTKEKSLSEVTESGPMEKCLAIHLSMSSQVTDANNKNMETKTCVQNSKCNFPALHNPSQSASFEYNKELKNEDEVVASCENTVYSDDFTGTISSDSSLGDSENSFDPLEETPEQNQSVTDSDAKMSERSLTPDVSPPLPIPSAVSPVQSLKKTSDIKFGRKNTVIALSVLDSDGPCARPVREDIAAQNVKKDEKKVVVKLEGKQVILSVDGNLGESVEKSQSLRTSQVSSYLPSNVSDIDLSGSEDSKISNKETDDDIEMLDVNSQCKHISELVISSLPGYTM